MRRSRLLVLLLPSALLACTSDDDAEPGEGTAVTTTVATATTEPVATVPMPDGAQAIEVDELGVRFGAPEGWETVDPDDLADATTGTVLEQLAERADLTPEEMAATIDEQVALYVFSNEPDESFTPNINVVDVPTDVLPTDEEITAQFEDFGANGVVLARVDASGNEAVTVRYQLRVGETKVRGFTLFVDVGGEVVNITVTMNRRRDADEVGELVTSTVGPSG